MEAKNINGMKFYDFEDYLDEELGTIGTAERDKFEAEVDDAVNAYKLGEAIKEARLSQHLTQEELGERIGVKKARISRIEKGHTITLSTVSKVFKALGLTTASLDLGQYGKVALW